MTTYGWVWIDGEDDDEGKSWIQIGPIEDSNALVEEMAVIICRNYERTLRDHPEWIRNKERDAQTICDALNKS